MVEFSLFALPPFECWLDKRNNNGRNKIRASKVNTNNGEDIVPVELTRRKKWKVLSGVEQQQLATHSARMLSQSSRI